MRDLNFQSTLKMGPFARSTQHAHINNDYIIRLFDQILHNSTISPFDYDFASKLRHHFAFAETAVIRSMVVEQGHKYQFGCFSIFCCEVQNSEDIFSFFVCLWRHPWLWDCQICRAKSKSKAATAKLKLCQISKTRKNHFEKNTSEIWKSVSKHSTNAAAQCQSLYYLKKEVVFWNWKLEVGGWEP